MTPPLSNPTAGYLARRPSDNFATYLSADVLAADATIPLNSVVGLSTDTAVTLVIDPGGANQETIIGWVSSNNIVNCARHVEGATTDHAHGTLVESYQTAIDFIGLVDFVLVSHNPDGTLKALPTDSVGSDQIAAGAVTTDEIADHAVDSIKLSIDTSTDANGWHVKDFGTHKRYTQRWIINQTVTGAGARATIGSKVHLPVGVANFSKVMATSNYSGAFAGHAVVGLDTYDDSDVSQTSPSLITKVWVQLGNIYDGSPSLAFVGFIDVVLEDFV